MPHQTLSNHMYVIEATNAKGWRWISGVFHRRTDAQNFFDLIPEADRALQRIVDIPATLYPMFITENAGFEYGDLSFIQAKIQSLTPQKDPDHRHMNVYAVLEDFAPSIAGRDRMGALPHWHITDSTLEPQEAAALLQTLKKLKALGSHGQ